jgi:hypothetical protein
MPGLASILAALEPAQPLRGARIACTLPLTPAAAVVAQALRRLGAALRWMPTAGGESSARYLLDWTGGPEAGGPGPNLLLEHGATASRLIHAGTRNEGRQAPGALRHSCSAIATGLSGTTEVAAHGARWLARRSRSGDLLYPAMDCCAIGPFEALSIEDRGLRTSAAVSLVVLSQVHLHRDGLRAAALATPPGSILRTVSQVHDALLRARIEGLRDKPASAAPDRGAGGGAA